MITLGIAQDQLLDLIFEFLEVNLIIAILISQLNKGTPCIHVVSRGLASRESFLEFWGVNGSITIFVQGVEDLFDHSIVDFLGTESSSNEFMVIKLAIIV